VFRNGSNRCTSNFAGVFAAEEFYLRRVTVFIGPSWYVLTLLWKISSFIFSNKSDSNFYWAAFILNKYSKILSVNQSFANKFLSNFQWSCIRSGRKNGCSLEYSCNQFGWGSRAMFKQTNVFNIDQVCNYIIHTILLLFISFNHNVELSL